MMASVSPLKPGALNMDMLMAGGFVMAPTWLFRVALVLPGAQLKVLLFLVLRLVHRRKAHDYVALDQIKGGCGPNEEGTGLSRSAIKSAISALETEGYLQVRHQTWGPSLFSLGWRFTTLGQARSETESRPGGAESDPDKGLKTGPTLDTFSLNRCSSSTCEPVIEPRHDDAFCTLMNEGNSYSSPTPVDDPSRPCQLGEETFSGDGAYVATLETDESFEGAALDSPTQAATCAESRTQCSPVDFGMQPVAIESTSQDLFQRLTTLTRTPFSGRTAAWIIATYPRAAIEMELDYLPHRNAANPAGFLLTALKAGDFAPPKRPMRPPVFRAPADFQSRPSAVSPGPHMPPVVAVGRSEPTDEAADLPPEVRADFVLQARRRFAQMLTLPLARVSEDHPVVEGYFLDLVMTYREKTLVQSAA